MTETITQTSPLPRPGRSRLPLIAGAAAAVAALAVGAVMMAGGNTPAAKPKAQTTLALALPSAGGAMQSCIPFDVKYLKDMSPAFAGTVTATGSSSVTLAVDHWYAGGTADVVTLTQPDANGAVSLEGGITFEQGKRYLVTAVEGVVNGCGYTVEATADMEAAFAEAFPG
jgi:hypothetical protein